MRRSSFLSLSSSGTLALALALLAIGCSPSNEPSSAGGDGGAGGQGASSSASGTGGTGGAGGDGGEAAGTGGAGGDGGEAAGTGGAGGGAPAGPGWDWTGIVGTGQSLSVGAEGTPPRTTEQRFNNLKLSLGDAAVPPFDASNGAFSLAPLTEPIRGFATTYPSAYPKNIYGETPHTAMADQISTLAQAAGGDHVTVHTVVGESGQPMSVLRKGANETTEGATSMGRAYAATLFEAEAIARLAREAGKTYGIGAIIITHGESDAGSATYEDDLVKLWSDYNADLLPITGQSRSIPLLVSQQHSVHTAAGTRSTSTQAQWRVGASHPGDIICSGPKYQYPYAEDAVHLTAHGYQLLGEKYGQVYFEKVVLGKDWQPLQPTRVERSGNVITVRFHVPAPPLAWDSALPSPHQTAFTEWSKGRGFQVWSGDTRIEITSVEIDGDAVKITCASGLPTSGAMVGYAATTDGTAMPGGTTRWGQLRDSDPFVGSITGKAQPNYSVAFEMNVP
ncbi:dockerin [Sorangium sp. So ce1097]|uniref:dockerin n=1 Tax=Sorangium sp. So ce1097 TaxID=3133330 RepID=UPI003F636463